MEPRVNVAARAAAAALALASLHGCVVLDARETLTIEPAGTLYGGTSLRLRVNGACERVHLEIDGRELEESIPANAEVILPLALADGAHRLVARAREGALAGARAERSLVVDSAPLGIASFLPGPGVVVAEPFLVEVRLTNRIEAGTVPDAFLTPTGAFDGVPVAVAVSEDRRGVSLAVAGRIADATDTGIALRLVPVGERFARTFRMGAWRAPSFTVSVQEPLGIARATGPIRFRATATGELPAQAELRAGEHLVAALGPPPWDVEIDPLALPDGVHRLNLRARGYAVYGEFPAVAVDNTAPRVTRCAPAESPPDQAHANECVRVEFSEPVFGEFATATLAVDGTSRPTVARPGSYYGGSRWVDLCPAAPLAASALPIVETVTLPPLEDASGIPLAPFSCRVGVPAWRAPWGERPLGAVAAADAAFGCGGLLVIPASGIGAGGVQEWSAAHSSPPWKFVMDRRVGATAVASDLGPGVWIEREGVGPGRVRACGQGEAPLNADTGRDARRPTADRNRKVFAWSEEAPAGGRVVRAALSFAAGLPGRFGDAPRLAAGAVADAPAITDGPSGPGGVVRELLAWIETAPGGVPQVRAALRDGAGWAPVADVANGDPSSAAADVVAWADDRTNRNALAWQEGGAVVALTTDWTSPPTRHVLDVEPARAARLPRFDELNDEEAIVYWVESSASGDEIWARRWDGAAWELLPGPVNRGAEGRSVRRLNVSAGKVVWVDDAGTVHLRARGF